MGAYNFQHRFEQPILAGVKRHTIRAPRKIEDVPGNTFHGFVGMRQPGCRKIVEAPYLRHEPIVIEPRLLLIEVNGIELCRDERDALAKADGFDSLAEMMQFWKDHKVWSGLIHYWDFERRVTA